MRPFTEKRLRACSAPRQRWPRSLLEPDEAAPQGGGYGFGPVAGVEGPMNVLVAVIGGEHDYAGVGELIEDRSGRGEPVHDRHAEIHEDDVGAKFAILLERFLTVRRLSDHLEVRFGREESDHTGP